MGLTTRAAAPALPLATLAYSAAPTSREPDPEDARKIADGISALQQTEHGAEVANFLAESHIGIEVIPGAEYRQKWPGSGAHFDPKRNVIRMPDYQLDDTDFLTVLAHEGTHARDADQRAPWFIDVFRVLGGSAKEGAKALVTFQNPVTAWLDGITVEQNEDEVHAYHVQAQVAQELGLNESSWALGQAKDGSPLPLDEVRANIAGDELYRMQPWRRLILGAGLGVGVTTAAALGTQTLASRIAPGSYMAAHVWPVYAIGGAMTAAWVLADQMHARQLDASNE